MRVTRARFALLVLVVSAVVLAACGNGGNKASASGDDSVAKLALYQGSDRQAKLVAAAKAEMAKGPVVIYAQGTNETDQPIFDAFKKQYPFFQVKYVSGTEDQISQRLVQEYKAGKYTMDLCSCNPAALVVPLEQGILQSFYSPELAAYPADAKDAQNRYAVFRQFYLGLGYNTKALTASEVPKTIAELADPKWKGKMAVSDSTAEEFVSTVVKQESVGFANALKNQNIKLVTGGGHALDNLVVSGEVELSPTIYDTHVQPLASKGAPIAWQPLDLNFATQYDIALATHAPHPAMSLLLIDFLLSQQSQEQYVKLGEHSLRTGITDSNPIDSNINILPFDPVTYEKDFDQNSQIAEQIFFK
jgi:iron(III) transport system substrate-binding protein